MTFEMGKKESSQAHFTTDITDKDEIEEIMKITRGWSRARWSYLPPSSPG